MMRDWRNSALSPNCDGFIFMIRLSPTRGSALRPLTKLEILHLGKTGVTFAGADEFEKDLPRSPIIR